MEGRLCTQCRSIPWQKLLGDLPDDSEAVHHEACEDVHEMLSSATKGCHLCSILLGSMDLLNGPDTDDPEDLEPAYHEPVNLRLTREIGSPSPTHGSRGPQDQTPVVVSGKFSIHVSVGSLAGGKLTLTVKDASVEVKANPLSKTPSTVEIARYWLEQCLDGHKSCGRDRTLKKLPTRVLDVGKEGEACTPRLVVTDGAVGQYCALSYCWGQRLSVRTTRASLEQHLQAIPMAELGRTLRDAISITRGLGVQYLWLDTLCIIQDDKEDWEREAVEMGRIYERSVLTIAALSSKDGDGGCMYEYSKLGVAPCEVFPGGTLVRAEVKGTRRRFTFAPLQRRAWTFQEAYLPHRMLYCEREMLVWHCRSGFRSEFDPTFFAQFGGKKMLTCRESSDYFHSLDDWQTLVSEYSRRRMTFDSDKLPAFSGIAEKFARDLASERERASRANDEKGLSSGPGSLVAADDSAAPMPLRVPSFSPQRSFSSDLLEEPQQPQSDNGEDSGERAASAIGSAGPDSVAEGRSGSPGREDQSDEGSNIKRPADSSRKSSSSGERSNDGAGELESAWQRHLFEWADLVPLNETSGLLAADEYVCGFWKKDIIAGLVWTYPSENQTFRQPTSHRPPSWSWVAAEGPVRFPYSPRDEKLYGYAEVLDIDVHVPGVNPFGQVSRAKITLEGPVRPVPFYVDDWTFGATKRAETHPWSFAARRPAGRWLSCTNDTDQYIDPGTVDLDGLFLSPHAIALRVHGFRCLLLEPVQIHRPSSPNTEGQVYRRAGVWSMESVLRKLLTDASEPWTQADMIDAIHLYGDHISGNHPEDLLDALYAKERIDVVEASFGIGNWERRVVTII